MARVLLVHDDAPALREVGPALGREGHEVVAAASAGLASALAGTRLDVAVLALRTATGSGVDLLVQVRAEQPDCARVLVGAPTELSLMLDAVNRAQVARVVQESAGAPGVVRAVREVLAAREELAAALERRRAETEQVEALALREALAPGAVGVAFQPIVEAASERIVAHEVLARTAHPAFPTTALLVDAAERGKQLDVLTRGVVAHLARRLARAPTGGRVFLNVHADELSDADRVLAALEPLAPHAHRVVIEVSDRLPVRPGGGWVRSLEELGNRGYAIALDDLGAGNSSLRMLAELQPQFVKIDMGIVRDVDVEPSKQRLVELLCRFAEANHAQVIAEGVETRLEAETLVQCGVSMLQGFLFGRPQDEPAGAPGAGGARVETR